jgi:hypothetical protein
MRLPEKETRMRFGLERAVASTYATTVFWAEKFLHFGNSGMSDRRTKKIGNDVVC